MNSRLPRRMRRLVQMFAARRCGKHLSSAKYEYKSKTIQRCNSLSRVSSVSIHLSSSEILQVFNFTMGGSRGGIGVRTPPPPGKSQVILVSIGDKQLDPLPKNSWTPPPPPPLKNDGSPLEPRKMIFFYESNRWSSVE